MLRKTLFVTLSAALMALFTACSAATADPQAGASTGASAGAIAQVTAAELPARLDAGARLIDVREPSEYQGGHVPGAELVPLATVTAAAADWDRSAPITVICRSGHRSMIAAQKLEEMGFSSIVNVQGGMLAWRGAAVTGGARGSWK